MKYPVFVLLTAALHFGASAQDLSSEIKAATVYRSEAFIERGVRMEIQKGNATLNFTGLPQGIDLESIKVKATPEFQVLDIRPEQRSLEHDSIKFRSIKLEADYKKAVRAHKKMRSEWDILKREESVLLNNTSFKGEQNGLQAAAFKANMDYLGKNLRRLRQEMTDQQAIVEQQAILVNRINGQIQLLRSKRSKSEQIVRVQIDAPKTANYEISISYLEGNAGWRPSYELSCTSLDQALHLVAKGKVQQQTGTDWEQVDLKLTTADPSRGNMPPEFEIFRLNFGRPYRPQPIGGPSLLPSRSAYQVQGIVFDRQTLEALPFATLIAYDTRGNFSGSAITAEDGSFELKARSGIARLDIDYIGYRKKSVPLTADQPYLSLPMEAESSQLEEVVISSEDVAFHTNDEMVPMSSRGARVKKSVFSQVVAHRESNHLHFSITQPQDIPSSGQEISVHLREWDLPALFQYVAYPAREEQAFLFAYIPDWRKHDLLSGEVALSMGGQYLGTTRIDARSMKDSLEIPMGRDQQILIRRETIRNEQSKSIFGGNMTEERSFAIHLKNEKESAISMEVIDQIPVSSNPDIVVKVIELNGGQLQQANGKVSWKVRLEPGSSMVLPFSYSVRYPKNSFINLPR
jgi:hypothetical protein